MSLRSLGPRANGAADRFLEVLLGNPRATTPAMEHLLEPMAEIVGAEVIGWHEMALEQGEGRTLLWPEPALQELAEQMMREHRAAHPLLIHYAATRTFDVLEPHDVWTASQWHGSIAYQIIREAFGVTQQLAIPIGFENGVFLSFALGRRSRAYNARERQSACWIQRSIRAARQPHSRLEPKNEAVLGPFGLSPRERQVIAALRTGCTRAAAARALDISPRTMDKHVEHIYRKLGVKSLVEGLARLDQR